MTNKIRRIININNDKKAQFTFKFSECAGNEIPKHELKQPTDQIIIAAQE